MQRIAISIYIDNHETIQYPIEYICSRLAWADEIWIHAGDDVTHALVKASCEKFSNVHFHLVNHKIDEPKDIAIGRTKCFDWLRNNTTCEWFIALSADTLPTDLARDYIFDRASGSPTFALAGPGPESISTHLACLYVDAGWSYWGCMMFHRSYIEEWASDGSYFKDQAGAQGTRLSMCIHLGYLGTDALGKHLIQHTKTWRKSGDYVYSVDHANDYRNLPRDQFIERKLYNIRQKQSLSGHNANPFIPNLIFVDEPEFWAVDTTGQLPHREVGKQLSDEYVRAIQHFGLQEDLNNVRAIANRMGRAKV